jgi:hypothetical protein
MKRVLLIIFMAQTAALGAVPTPAQVDAAKACFYKIVECGIDGVRYANAAESLLDNGGNLTVPGSTTTVAVPQVLIDETVDKYKTKKQACVAAFNTCP